MHATGRSTLALGAAAVSLALLATTAVAPSLASATDATTDLEPVGSRSAAEQRDEADPALTTMAQPPERTDLPADRYAMAGGCYTMTAPDGRVLTKSGGTYVLSDDSSAAEPIHFQATELGRYLLWDSGEQFVSHASGTSIADEPSPQTEWTIDGTTDDFIVAETLLGVTDGWRFRTTTGCPTWPEIEVNVSGRPFAGTSPIQEVRGYIDDHIHQVAADFLGGGIHCGRPWHRYGVEYALKDCDDHIATDGKAALPEIVLSGVAEHDPTGWPTFTDWPAPDSLTHEGVYHKWVERAWRGGQRMFVNLLVENEVLCVLYPNLSDPIANVPGVTKNCNDMDQMRHQAQLIHEMQDYIDAQWGGPGRGWFRIVGTPQEARRVINEGKLAVVLGTESSDIFNCSKAGATVELIDELPATDSLTCTPEDLDAGLDELHDLGVRQMVITHKFDNAFGGAKGDHGFNGIATNAGNFLQNGTFFDMGPCTDGLAPDNKQLGPDDAGPFGAVIDLLAQITFPVPGPALPIYQEGDQCNQRGLTELGEQMIRKMAERNIMVDVDHFNSKTRSQALDVLEELEYAGTVSSHSWADDLALPRVYELGGFVSPYAGDSTTFAQEWEKVTTMMDGRFYFGVGFGADTNGLGAQGDPRGADTGNPVTYPFSGFGDIEVDHQHSGERVYDINVDGVAHYGLYPDWWEDLRMLEGSDILTDMRRGSEAFLQMWERADGATNDACRQPELRRPAGDFAGIAPGTSATEVLHTYGQPHVRAGQTYRYCALQDDGSGPATVTVRFDDESVASVDGTTGGTDADDGAGSETGASVNDGPASDSPASDSTASDSPAEATSGGAGEPFQAADAWLADAGGPELRWILSGLVALAGGALLLAHRRRTA